MTLSANSFSTSISVTSKSKYASEILVPFQTLKFECEEIQLFNDIFNLRINKLSSTSYNEICVEVYKILVKLENITSCKINVYYNHLERARKNVLSDSHLEKIKSKNGIHGGLMNYFGFDFYHFTIIPPASCTTLRTRYNMKTKQSEPFNPFISDDIFLNAPIYKVERLASGATLFQLTETLNVFEKDQEYVDAWVRLYNYLYDNMKEEYRTIGAEYVLPSMTGNFNKIVR